ncbi:MAG TPA: VWA domain-containing protein [Blastocatellia bacterium]|jgi:Mg-chelatase subunit ChlD
MGVEFTNPWALMLLALIPATIYMARRGLASLSRARGAASLTARSLILLLVVLALAGLRIRATSRDVAILFLVDVSSSIAQSERAAVLDLINREVERAAPRDYVGVIAFGAEASVELAPTRKEALGDWRISEISSDPPRDYTNIAAALRLAGALVPKDAIGRIVLISDGNENLESAMAEAPMLSAESIETYARAIGTTSERDKTTGEIALRDITAPEQLAEGEAFDLRVTIDSTRDTDAILRVMRNDSVVGERTVRLAAGGENIFVLPQRADEKGFYTYRAEIEAAGADSFVQNNSREAFAIVEGRPKTLYLYGDGRPSPAVSRVLEEGNFAATIRPAAGLPTTLAGFQDYDLVIFDNVPAAVMTTGQMRMLQSYVRDLGGGFVMIGGDQSFGPGGYYKTPVEEVLPVSLDVRQKKHFPSLAIALVIDKSGSMDGIKMEMTREAAQTTIDFLSDRDRIGVVAFDSEANSIFGLTPVENKEQLKRQISAIEVGGGTNMFPGIDMAYGWLQSSDAQMKHIIVLSDGQSEPGDFTRIARNARDAGITLTTVAVGDDADVGLMQMLAEVGDGRFYAADRPDMLPRIFTREAMLASRTTIIEEPFAPRLVRPSQATAGIDWGSAPQLGGYVGTAERDPASSPAITSLVSDKDDPVYALWQYGLGRSAAFTSDAKARWASSWMNWPGFGQFWAQLFRDTLRRQAAADFVPRVEINAGRGHVTVEAISPEGDFRNNLRLSAHIIAPDLSTIDVALEQTAAGRYEADFEATARGAYLVSVSEAGGQAAPVTGSVNSYSPEFAITGADEDLLLRLSEQTGGALIKGDEASVNLFERSRTRTRPFEIWETLLLGALLLLPIDVGLRRVHITREQLSEARHWIVARFKRKPAETEPAEAVGALAQLKDARSRVRLSDDDKTGQVPGPAPAPRKAATTNASAPVSTPSGREVKVDVAPTSASASEEKPLASRLLDARRRRKE